MNLFKPLSPPLPRITHILVLSLILASCFIPATPSFSETITYEYDELNRLWKATYSDGTIIEYKYNEIGNITDRIVTKPSTYTITVIQSSGGMISPSTTSVTYLGSALFYIVLDAGYHTVDVLVDNASQGSWQTYTLSNITQNHTITASFSQTNPFRIAGVGDFATLQAAYDNAPDGSTIKCQSVTIANSLTANRNISVIIDGGYNADYTANSAKTKLIGLVKISSGKVTLKNVNIRK